jgi:hypothetical protein
LPFLLTRHAIGGNVGLSEGEHEMTKQTATTNQKPTETAAPQTKQPYWWKRVTNVPWKG